VRPEGTRKEERRDREVLPRRPPRDGGDVHRDSMSRSVRPRQSGFARMLYNLRRGSGAKPQLRNIV
jgi:hypothetical protein